MGKIIGLTFPVEGKAKQKKGGGRPVKAELLARLEELGVEAPDGATNDALGKLVKEAEAAKKGGEPQEDEREAEEPTAVVDEP